jgi:hypothetical protein
MSVDATLAALAALTEDLPDQAVRTEATIQLWASVARKMALDEMAELSAAVVQLGHASRHYTPTTALLACYITIAKIKRASMDFMGLAEFDQALRDLAAEITGALPLKPPPP